MEAAKISITPLGGQEEIGLNSHLIEIGDEAILIDLGNNFSDTQFGVDYYIPNIDIINSHREKIRAIFLTHGHYDHRAAIPFFTRQLSGIPIYGSTLTIELVKDSLRRSKGKESLNLQVIQPQQFKSIGQFSVQAIPLTHSIPESYGYFIKTSAGNIFHTGDYKIDQTPFGEKPFDYDLINSIAREGVLVLMIDSTRADIKGHSISETAVASDLEEIIASAPGRVIASTFAQMIFRLTQVILIGQKLGRKPFLEGTSLERVFKIGRKIGYFKDIPPVMSASKMKDYPDNQILLLATGSQGEERAALNKMLQIDQGPLRIKASDTIIFSSSRIPENAIAIQKLTDRFSDRGCRVYHLAIADVHAGGHAHQDEIIEMIRLVKPKFIFPIQGYVSFRRQLKYLALEHGYRLDQVAMVKDNQTVLFTQNYFKKMAVKKSLPSVVIGQNLFPDGNSIVAQRKKIAKRGIVFLLYSVKGRLLQARGIGVPELVLDEIRNHLRFKADLSLSLTRKIHDQILPSFLPEELIPEVVIEFLSQQKYQKR